MKLQIDEDMIRQAIAILKPGNELYEVRLVAGKRIKSIYSKGADNLIQQLRKVDAYPGTQCYLSLQHIDEACYSREQHECFRDNPKATGKCDIDGLEWFLIDFDPVRPTGISSSENELNEALNAARRCHQYLHALGFGEALVAMSGNGYHLLYRIALENTPERIALLDKVMKQIGIMCDTDKVKVDLSTTDAPQTFKLYGTKATKGADTADRPHRMSAIIHAPAEMSVVDIAYLEKVAGKVEPEPEKPSKANHYNPGSFDVVKWLDEHGLRIKKSLPLDGGGTKHILEECPFDSSHKAPDSAIIVRANGCVCFNCFHSSCADKKWRDVRLKYEPDAYDRKQIQATPNHQAAGEAAREKINQAADDLKQPIWLSPEEIRQMPMVTATYIPTGIQMIDDKIGGLRKGGTSLLTGLSSAGKSSILSMIALNAIDNGYRVALFSGEMPSDKVSAWLTAQAAGMNHMKRVSQTDGLYRPTEGIEAKVSEWMNPYLRIFNNDYGAQFEILREALANDLEDFMPDLILLDNLMAIDIEALDRDKYSAQSKFINEIAVMARKLNAHIMLVAHPRKQTDFLRLEDVSGTADLRNRVDLALIIHRVNTDFRKRSAEYLGWKTTNKLYMASNVIELAKDRDNGTQDVFVPLWYEFSTKRLKNDPGEYRHYGWETDSQTDNIEGDEQQ